MKLHFRAEAEIKGVVECEDSCTGESWEAHYSSGRTAYYPITIPVPNGICGKIPPSPARRMCQVGKVAQLAGTAENIDKALNIATEHFDTLVKVYEEAIDASNWCKLSKAIK